MACIPHGGRAGELLDLRTEGGKETLTLTLPDSAGSRVFTLDHPDRLVIDVPRLRPNPAPSLPPSYRGELIKTVRFGQFSEKTSRFVFDLHVPVRARRLEDAPGRVTVEMVAAAAVAVEKEPERKSRPAKRKAAWLESESKPAKPMIVIDPGHGGEDPGARGHGGLVEKDVVMEYARSLRNRLLKSGRYDVVLTRENDRYIALRKRFEIARKARAALFISLHADSAPDKAARGLSVYTLSERASDEEAEALAAQENKSDFIAGIDLSEESKDVAGILISLAERDTGNRSATLADFLVTSLDGKVPLLPNSHRFAGFAVLKAPDVPSVLVEIGFLSHPKEEKLIRSKAHREKVTGGLAAGIDAYFRFQQKMGGL